VTERRRDRVRVWDLPTRLFHWGMAALVVAGLATGFFAPEWWLEIHIAVGLGAAALVAFRVVWGLYGSEHSRFASFAYGPRAVIAHLRGMLRGRPGHWLGHNPAGAIMVFTLLAETGITKGADLKGKKIGITRLGSASDLAVRAALERFGLNTKDVTMISLGGIPEILAGMRAGAINAGILSPPTSTAARDLGYRSLLHIPDLGREFTFSGIAARRSFVRSQPEVARAYMASLTDGAKTYKEDSRAALRVLRKYMRAEDRILESGYKEYDKAISSPPYPGLKGLEAVRDSLIDSTPQLKQADLRKFVDDRFVKAK